MKRWLTIGAIALLALWGCEPESAPDAAIAAVSGQRAAELFAQHCAICHGERGDGRGVRRGSLHSKPPDFRQRAWRKEWTLANLRAVIRNGSPGTDMPAWKTLTESEVAGLAEYVLAMSSDRDG